MKKISLFFVLFLAVIAAVVYTYGKNWLEGELKRRLAAQGLGHIGFTLASVGAHQVVFTGISFGPGVPVVLDKLTADYSPRELLLGQLRGIHADEIVIKQSGVNVRLHDAALVFAPAGGKSWTGTWSFASADIEQLPLTIPTLSGAGDFSADSDKLTVSGDVKSTGNKHRAGFSLDYYLKDKPRSRLAVKSAALPWNGGTVKAKNAVIALDAKRASTIPLSLERVSLDALLGQATGGRAGATGTVSGAVPLAWKNGVSVQDGLLKADTPGQLRLAADLIPGDNNQVAQVRMLLADFSYRSLSIAVDSDEKNKLSMRLSVEGNNPSVYAGRAVKLNVNLRGDVLEMVQQSVLPMASPEEFLKGTAR